MFLNTLVYMVESKESTGISVDTWFNLIGTIVGAIIGGVIAFYVAKTQINEQAKNDSQREKYVISQKLKLDTYLDINSLVREYGKEVALLYANIALYEVNNIDREEYDKKFYQLNELDIPTSIRMLIGKMIIFPELAEKHNIIRMHYGIYSSMIYNVYYGDKNNFFEDNIDSFETEDQKELFASLNESYLENHNQAITDIYYEHEQLTDNLLEDIRNEIEKIVN